MTRNDKTTSREDPMRARQDHAAADPAPPPEERSRVRFAREEKQLARLSHQVQLLTEEVSNTRVQVGSHHHRLHHLVQEVHRLNRATQGLHDQVLQALNRLKMLWESKPWRFYSRLGRLRRLQPPEPAVLPESDLAAISPPFEAAITPVGDSGHSMADLYLPYQPSANSYLVPREPPEAAISEVDGLPLPPAELMLGHPDADRFISWGQEHVANMRRLLQETGFDFSPGLRVLDFGCGSGRLLRHFASLATEGEYWGVDIRAEHILWCKQQLSPPFHFAVTTLLPHLPFEDRHFDLIYAGSVFTHIDDLADAWFLELKRILKPGGLLYFTIHDHHSIDRVMSEPDGSLARQVLASHDDFEDYANADYSMFTLWRSAESQVFYDFDYLLGRLELVFDVVTHRQEAYGFQTAIVVRKP